MKWITKETYRGKPRWMLSPILTALVGLGMTGFITLVCVWIQPGSFLDTMRAFYHQPLLIALNWFPVIVFTAVLYFLLGNLFFSGAISGGVMAIMSYVNLLKIEGREDPFVPSDILLFREAMNAAGEYQLDLHWEKLLLIAALLAAAIALGIFFKTPKLRRWPVRVLCVVLCIALFACAVRFVYTDKDLYSSFKVPYAYNIPSVFNTLGFNYCFWYNYNLYPVDKPDGYSRAEVECWDQTDGAAEPEVKPNVLMVMCEAFSDLSDEPVFLYSPEDDPLAGFRTVASSERAVSGHIVVSNYGAGTANTEFDVLTGMQTNMIGEGTTSSFRVVRRPTRSIAALLKDAGYNTFFMHPGQSWFYNRMSVYSHLGISDQVFSEAFDESDFKGTMISDAAFLDELRHDLNERMLGSDAPLFTYSVTIQNHQAYGYGKYDERPAPVPLSVSVSDGAMEQLSVYMEGVRDSSEMLVALTQYLDALDKPTVLVFFGDHRPNLGTACTELGLRYNLNETPQETVDTYAVPYVIWSNEAYASAVDLPARYAALALPENGYLSDNYLGAMVLQLIGYHGQSAFFDELNALRAELPVLREREATYCLADGTYTDTLPPELAAAVSRLHKWTYYLLK